MHPRYRTPHLAIVALTIWSAMLALSGTYEQLFTYVMFASILFSVAPGSRCSGCAGRCPIARDRTGRGAIRSCPSSSLLGSAAFVVNTLLERPIESLAGLGLLALGLPAYWYWQESGRSLVAESCAPAHDSGRVCTVSYWL